MNKTSKLKERRERTECFLEESIAERCGLIWTIAGKEVFDKTHAGFVNLIKMAGNRLERGDHIVKSFEKISRSGTKIN